MTNPGGVRTASSSVSTVVPNNRVDRCVSSISTVDRYPPRAIDTTTTCGHHGLYTVGKHMRHKMGRPLEDTDNSGYAAHSYHRIDTHVGRSIQNLQVGLMFPWPGGGSFFVKKARVRRVGDFVAWRRCVCSAYGENLTMTIRLFQ